ncbi:MAG: tetratricopeptide repeat protein [Tahibacter sp.]
MSVPPIRYCAFISYSHRDSALTRRLHRRLESYSVPRALRGQQPDGTQVPARLQPVFRDRDELASTTSLSHSIQEALEASAALIVVCSPAAVASPWVDAEIAHFRRLHPERPVLAFVVAGDPGVDPRADPEHAAFPRNLLLVDVDDASGALGEPVAADARELADGFSAAFLKLVAGLLSLRYDQLRRRELRRRQQRWALLAGLSVVLASVFAVLAWQATIARNEARAAQSVAELELQSERQTRDFLLSIFHLADANEARGNSVTVREALDRAVARIDHSEFSRPAIRARFLATMGQAYSSLGLNQRSVALLRKSIDTIAGQELGPDAGVQRIDSRIELADVFYTMGEYPEALAQLDAVGDHPSPRQRVRLKNVRGDVLAYSEKDAEARLAYNEALAGIELADFTREDAVLARSRSMSGLALLALFAGDYSAAERAYADVINVLLPVVGEMHPETISAYITHGASAFQNGDLAAAKSSWLHALGSAQQVYDAGSPQIGTIQNNLGRLLLESGELTGAEPMLRDALASDRKHRSATFDDLAYPLYNLAFVRFLLGDADEARTLLEEALPIADKSKHRMLGPILSGLADLNCSTGRTQDGIVYAERAVSVTQEHDDVAHWYTAQAQLTQRYCQSVAGTPSERSDLVPMLAALRQKWGDANPFTRRGAAQLHAIESGTGHSAAIKAG